MSNRIIDMVGQKYGRLTVIRQAGMKDGKALWECKCDCGRTKIALGTNIRSGITQSCGCLARETARKLIANILPLAAIANTTHGPSKKHSIDRIDNNKGYSPENCRWATQDIQSNNKSDNVMLTYMGETMGLRAWSARTGIPYKNLRHRYYNGLTINEIFNPEVRFKQSNHSPVINNLTGVVYPSLRACAEADGIKLRSGYRRLNDGKYSYIDQPMKSK